MDIPIKNDNDNNDKKKEKSTKIVMLENVNYKII